MERFKRMDTAAPEDGRTPVGLGNTPPGGGMPTPRAPKVTVTREGNSLCQKVCYPMARMFFG